MKKPEAGLVGEVPTVSWGAVKFGSGPAVGGYLVFRNDEGDRSAVCRVPAATLTCADGAAEAGRAVTYTVHATAGDHWVGPPSPISDLVIRPGDPVAPSLAAGVPKPPPNADGDTGANNGNSDEAPAGATADPGTTSGTPTPAPSSPPSAEVTSPTPAPAATGPDDAGPR